MKYQTKVAQIKAKQNTLVKHQESIRKEVDVLGKKALADVLADLNRKFPGHEFELFSSTRTCCFSKDWKPIIHIVNVNGHYLNNNGEWTPTDEYLCCGGKNELPTPAKLRAACKSISKVIGVQVQLMTRCDESTSLEDY